MALTKVSSKVTKSSQWGGDYIKLSDTKATGTAGGSSIAGTQTRALTTKDVDTGNICTLNVPSKQFTLPAGTYRIKASAPSFRSGTHKAILYNVSDLSNVIIGESAYTNSAVDTPVTKSDVIGQFVIGSEKTFEIRHYTQIIKTVDGLGIATSDGTAEVYTVVELWKID